MSNTLFYMSYKSTNNTFSYHNVIIKELFFYFVALGCFAINAIKKGFMHI